MNRISVISITLLAVFAAMTATAAPPQPESTDPVAVAETLTVAGDSLTASGTGAMPDSLSRPAPRRPKVTPVDIDDNKPPVVMHYFDKHGEPLKEPVMFLAALDTVTKPRSKPVYPLYNGVSVGLNFGDAVMMAVGDRFGSFDIHADVSLHNWFFPVVEAGIGFANATPEKNNFTYRVSPSFYAKVGLDYNFLYKSDPSYRIFLGLRAGFSSFRYRVEDISISDDYWGETQPGMKVGPLSSTAWWGEALAGIRVRIVGGFSLGWTLRYKYPFSVASRQESRPWFIPGYGANPFGFTISAVWTFGGMKKPPEEMDTAAQEAPDPPVPDDRPIPGYTQSK